jgi:hypothetical protein
LIEYSRFSVRVEILHGTALVEVVRIARGDDVHVVVGPTSTGFKGTGLHRFNTDAKELRVFGGRADVSLGDRLVEIERGSVAELGNTLSLSRFDPRVEAASGVSPSEDPPPPMGSPPLVPPLSERSHSWSHPINWEVTRVSRVANKDGLPTDPDRFYVRNRDFGVGLYFVPKRAGNKGQEGFLQN